MVAEDLEHAIVLFSETLGRVVTHPDFVHLGITSASELRRVRTKKGIFPRRLAPDGAIRGLDDVRATIETVDETSAPDLASVVRDAVSVSSASATWERSPELRALRDDSVAALDVVIDQLLKDSATAKRLVEHRSLVAVAPEDVEKYIASLDRAERHSLTVHLLADRFAAAVGAQDSADAEAIEWRAAGQEVARQLAGYAGRPTNGYELLGFLSGPAVPAGTDLRVVSVQDGPTVFDVHLMEATDSAIQRALGRALGTPELPPGLATANSVVAVRYEIAIGSGQDSAEEKARRALILASLTVDALRLVREDDLGLGFVACFGLDWGALFPPSSMFFGWLPSSAAYETHRTAFSPPSDRRLTAEEATRVQELASLLVSEDVPGLPVAIARFRDSYERYWPTDPQRLLELSIALEALFLGDSSDNKELKWRLSTRCARLVGESLDESLEIAEAVRALYDVRSSIAHGEDLSTLSSGRRSKLKLATSKAPAIVRRSLITLLQGNGPRGSKKAVTKWWRRFDVGGNEGARGYA